MQLLGYIVRISEREREIQSVERKKKRQDNLKQGFPENTDIEKECITVVLPVIMYHGQKDWNVDENLSAVYCSADSFVNYVPEFDFELIDLSNFKDDQITGNAYLRVAMLVMKHYNSDQFDEIFSTILSLLAEHLNEGTTIHFIATVTLYSSSHKLRGKKWLTSNIENNYIKAFGEKGGNVMNTVGNIWIEQGIKKGLIKKAREMVIEATKIKYNNASQPLTSILQSIKDEEILNNLFREVFLCNNISEFQHKLEKIRGSAA
ncbi:transposase YhgA family protein [Candidatus Magnetomorum sp. HK-1]|nr:transposase YhgA family protein [Candidatus Magnetomorum sp. HK-1]